MTDIERRFPAAEIQRIEVRIGLGDIQATAADSGEIVLRAQVRSNDETELETTIAGGVLIIKNRASSGWLGRNNSRIDVALTIPRAPTIAFTAAIGLGDVNLTGVAGASEIHTGKGDVRATGGASPLSVKTGKGDVAVRNWRGDLQVTTGKGDVAVSDLSGGLQITTGAGDTTVTRWLTNGHMTHYIKTGAGDVSVTESQAHGLEVNTGRGDCTLQHVTLGLLNAHTGLGSLAVTGDPQAGRWELRTGKGDLSLALPAGVAARVEAATRHGHIQSDLPQVKVGRPGPASQHGGRIIVVTGEEPRAEIRLETLKGDIAVRTASSVAMTVAPEPTTVVVETAVAAAAPSSPQMTAMSVLESLARGEISVDEAEALLRSLEPA